MSAITDPLRRQVSLAELLSPPIIAVSKAIDPSMLIKAAHISFDILQISFIFVSGHVTIFFSQVSKTLATSVLSAPGTDVKLLSTTQRDDDKGHKYYELEFTATAPRFSRHQLAVVTVANGRLQLVNPSSSSMFLSCYNYSMFCLSQGGCTRSQPDQASADGAR